MDASDARLNRYVTRKKAVEIIRGLSGAIVPQSVVCMHLENDVSINTAQHPCFDKNLPQSSRSPTRLSTMASWHRVARGPAPTLHTELASWHTISGPREQST